MLADFGCEALRGGFDLVFQFLSQGPGQGLVADGSGDVNGLKTA